MGYLKFIKRTPLVSSRDVVTYGMAKELAHILRLLVGQSPHHIRNTYDFKKQVKIIRLEEEQYIISCDVKALFTLDLAITIIRSKLNRTQTSTKEHTCPYTTSLHHLEFCLKNTYFLSQGMYYEGVHGATIWSCISPIVVNLFMEECETKPSKLQPTLLDCGEDMLMLHVTFGTFNIVCLDVLKY